MNESVNTTSVLTDEAVTEIEALSAKVPDGPWFTASDDADDVPEHRRSGLALVETGRSEDWWIARLCEWHIARFIAESKTNVDALCATVRALRAERTRLLDLVRYCRHQLHEEGLITTEDLALLLEAGPESVARLESYDELQVRLKEVEQELATTKQHRNDLVEELDRERQIGNKTPKRKLGIR